MVEALRTAASPAAIWAICAVVVSVLAFWLTAIMVADVRQQRSSRRTWPAEVPGPFLGDAPLSNTSLGQPLASQPQAAQAQETQAQETQAPPAGEADPGRRAG